ncbi:carbonic anhydrase [Diaminobutyricibacter sp. McL0618]|uniref:carbonic anhydrase n=1 Tax=Leifsonia sp. McL0618 TaxID=3415677 RepID=UPI003CE70DB1
MSLTDEALRANATIATDTDPDRANPPAPRIAIVTCADPRLSDIVRMLGLADADVDMIRNVGTVIDDDSIRSLVISTRVLGTREIMIINHDGCGLTTSRRDGDGADRAGQVLQLHRPRAEHEGAGAESQVASVDRCGCLGQGVRLRPGLSSAE